MAIQGPQPWGIGSRYSFSRQHLVYALLILLLPVLWLLRLSQAAALPDPAPVVNEISAVGLPVASHETPSDFPPPSQVVDSSEGINSNQTFHPVAATGPLPQRPFELTPPPDEYVAMCVAVRGQELDLPEFLAHHYYNIGISRFYIMDDGSEPPLSTFRNSFRVPTAALAFTYFPRAERVPMMQHHVYDQCIAQARATANHTWMAFFDADEFLDLPGGESLRDVMAALEGRDDVGALGVQWRIHTSSEQLVRAPSVLASYTTCIADTPGQSDNMHVKSIVRVRDYERPRNPHMFALRDGRKTVGEHGDDTDEYCCRAAMTRDRIALHHYAVKSLTEYAEKIARSNAMSQPKGWDWWEHIENDMEHVDCPEMLRWGRPPP